VRCTLADGLDALGVSSFRRDHQCGEAVGVAWRGVTRWARCVRVGPHAPDATDLCELVDVRRFSLTEGGPLATSMALVVDPAAHGRGSATPREVSVAGLREVVRVSWGRVDCSLVHDADSVLLEQQLDYATVAARAREHQH
jgi:hypothetical protein